MEKMYVKAAQIVKNKLESFHNDGGGKAGARWNACVVAESFIKLFKDTNPKFDNLKFLKDCGLRE